MRRRYLFVPTFTGQGAGTVIAEIGPRSADRRNGRSACSRNLHRRRRPGRPRPRRHRHTARRNSPATVIGRTAAVVARTAIIALAAIAPPTMRPRPRREMNPPPPPRRNPPPPDNHQRRGKTAATATATSEQRAGRARADARRHHHRAATSATATARRPGAPRPPAAARALEAGRSRQCRRGKTSAMAATVLKTLRLIIVGSISGSPGPTTCKMDVPGLAPLVRIAKIAGWNVYARERITPNLCSWSPWVRLLTRLAHGRTWLDNPAR